MQRSIFIIKKSLILACVMSFAIMTAGCASDTEGLQSKAAAEGIITKDTDTLADERSLAPENEAGAVPSEASEQPESTQAGHHTALAVEEESENEKTMKMQIEDTVVDVAWEKNESVDALKELAASGDLIIQLSMYGGFEQVGPVGASLPRNDVQTKTGAGDIVLYSGNQIVLFYGSNSWAYTRLGKITGKSASELEELLGNGDVTITISIK